MISMTDPPFVKLSLIVMVPMSRNGLSIVTYLSNHCHATYKYYVVISQYAKES
jgi:hypothetical protein